MIDLKTFEFNRLKLRILPEKFWHLTDSYICVFKTRKPYLTKPCFTQTHSYLHFITHFDIFRQEHSHKQTWSFSVCKIMANVEMLLPLHT